MLTWFSLLHHCTKIRVEGLSSPSIWSIVWEFNLKILKCLNMGMWTLGGKLELAKQWSLGQNGPDAAQRSKAWVLWFVRVGPILLNTRRAENFSPKPQNSFNVLGMNMFSDPCFDFCSLIRAFSSVILFHMLVHALDTLKIWVHRCGTRDTLTKVQITFVRVAPLSEYLAKVQITFVICCWKNRGRPGQQELFLLLFQSPKNLNIQNSWPHWLSTYSWQFSTGNRFHGKG